MCQLRTLTAASKSGHSPDFTLRDDGCLCRLTKGSLPLGTQCSQHCHHGRRRSTVLGSPGLALHRSALPRCQMAANQSVLVPDQSHHDNVEDRQHDETDAVRVREAIELVDDEETKDDKRNRIGPELISKQTDNEEHLND